MRDWNEMDKNLKDFEINLQYGKDTLENQIFSLGLEYFYISRSDISFSSDPGKVITDLVRDGWLLPYGRGKYLFGKHGVGFYLRNHKYLYESVLCLETAVWLHNLIDLTPFPVCAAINGSVEPTLNREKEVEFFQSPDWPMYEFEVEPLYYFGEYLKIYSRERTIVDLMRCDMNGRRKALAEEMMSTWWENGKLDPVRLESVAEKMDTLSAIAPYIATLKKRRRRKKAKLP